MLLVLLQLPPPACCWAASLVGDAVAAAAAPRQRGGENPAVVVAKGVGAPLACAEPRERMPSPTRKRQAGSKQRKGRGKQGGAGAVPRSERHKSAFAREPRLEAYSRCQLLERLPFLRVAAAAARGTPASVAHFRCACGHWR